MKAIHINTKEKTITDVEYHDLRDLRALVGGYIEIAYGWDTGDVMYVDEEGQVKPQVNGQFFFVLRQDQLLSGNGVVVGKEINNRGDTAPPTITSGKLRTMIAFRSPDRD